MNDLATRFPLGSALTWDALEGDVYPVLARLRAQEPVTWCPPLKAFAATTHEQCSELLRDEPRFETTKGDSRAHEVFGPTMLSTDDDEHRRQRIPFEGPFRVRPTRERFTDLIHEEVDRLVGEIEGAGGGELAEMIARRLPVRVMCAVLALGLDEAEVRATYDDFAAAVSDYRRDPEIDRRARATQAAFAARVAGELERMRAEQTDSVLGDVARDPESGISDFEIAANALVIMFGGIETVETLILNTMYALLSHPDQLQLLLDDPGLVPGALDESLRWAPPIGFLGRHSRVETELGGVPLAADTHTIALVVAANRDPAVFEDPDRFDVRRENARKYISFSYGKHFCLGFNLAKLEAEIAIRAMLERLPNVRVDPEHPLPPMHGISIRRPSGGVHLLWDPR
jgi:cytochrome P450